MFQIKDNIEEIEKNYNTFMTYIEQDSRAEQLKEFYKVYGDRLQLAPASGKVQFHNAYPGGYLDHIVRVVDNALRIAAVYKGGGGVIDFTKQELVFAGLHHDLGKLGSETEEYYLAQDSDWHRKQGNVYKHNANMQYFKVPDRGLMMLQKFGIAITENEWLAIKLSDGIYSSGNDSYLKNEGMKRRLPNIIHWADHMSAQIENDKNQVNLEA